MCFKNKCLYKFPVTQTCRVLSVIYAICNCLLLLWWFYIWYRYFSYKEDRGDGCGLKLGGICWGRQGRYKRDAIDDYLHHGWWIIPVTFFLTIYTLCTVISLVFSVLLCYGVYNRRPAFLKAFNVYGVVITVIFTMLSLIRLTHMEWTDVSEDPGLWALLACVLHALFIVLVVKTHNKMVDDAKPPQIHLQEVTAILPTAPPLRLLEDACNRGAEAKSVTSV